MNKFTTTKDTTVAEALNNMANEFATTNEMLNTMFQLVLAEKAKADARHAKYEAEEEAEHAERKAKRDVEKLVFHLGDKIEVLELGEKSDKVKVGDIFEITKIDLTSYTDKVTVKCGDVETEYAEDTIKKMIVRGWVKLVA